jgi:hypothetical protein
MGLSIRFGVSGQDAVDRDPVGPELLGLQPAERGESRAQGRGDRQHRVGVLGDQGRHVHDAAPAGLSHRGRDERDQARRREQGVLEAEPPLELVDRERRAGGRSAGVRHEDRRRAERGDGFAMPGLDLGALA